MENFEERFMMDNLEKKRTGKTGVAFGLIRSRDGASDVRIIPYTANETDEIPFPYLLGIKNRKDCFDCLIGEDINYNDWVQFRRCNGDEMDIYYTKEPRAHGGNLPISDVPYENLFLDEEHINLDGYIFIRKVSPNTIECTVATKEEIQGAIPDSRIYKLTLK